MGFEMYRLNRQFYGGDGIVAKGVENTIRNVGLLGHDGMRATDEMILKIMIHHTLTKRGSRLDMRRHQGLTDCS